ncbi:uncharacterized protein G2W53_002454 [Senna tora]|uniref:Uncharacterized protein n=1 Tax=Senna tora TaxID=362788 RepID=A0A835CKD0_9FABA|nr:uncharacterized protein G2W53_002454 [Senna tora]
MPERTTATTTSLQRSTTRGCLATAGDYDSDDDQSLKHGGGFGHSV